MKAILIDTKHRSVEFIELENDSVECLGHAIEEEHILPEACIDEALQNHFLITDEVTYLKEESSIYGAFSMEGFKKVEPFFNKALLVGPPANGRFTDCTLPLEMVAERVKFETEHNAREYHRIIRTQDAVKWDIRL